MTDELTNEIRDNYVHGRALAERGVREHQFDEWLIHIKAEAWAEGYLVGTGDGFNRSQGNATPNPYEDKA